MPIEGLNHFSVRTPDMKRSRDFYVNVLGFVEGDRPPFPFPGYWLYCGETAVVHVIGEDPDGEGLQGYLGERSGGAGAGSLDHIAFSASNLEGVRERLDALGVRYTERSVPLLGLIQLFVTDPDGITLELNFPETTSP